jgi:hypothetical protein
MITMSSRRENGPVVCSLASRKGGRSTRGMNIAILRPKVSAPLSRPYVGLTVLPRLPGAPVPIQAAIAVIQPDGGKRNDVEVTTHLCMSLAVKTNDVVVMLGFLQREPFRLKLAASVAMVAC